MPTKEKEAEAGKRKCDKCGVHADEVVIVSVKPHHMIIDVDNMPQRRPIQYCNDCYPTVNFV